MKDFYLLACQIYIDSHVIETNWLTQKNQSQFNIEYVLSNLLRAIC